ncbi:MAG: (5-formylfuran-3-yl)methyl phosphate synthase [Methylobacterium sp.]|uniref:(5-formylfuran-3-yl)methyl phosphate synthase n=1 Tax=Methylobacterium sp. TaxID=409 RepID=UPI0025D03B79|nr:(5-formylfuran-3-yl)methyl phosphate synthase [Methylobacterium sp.]MBX9933714.1 (5-formylfuran-3-yl)methyl phosphate synthase [Methylobacterium sp.]
MTSFDPTRTGPALLVSVRDADEAELAALAGADLVDAKDPDRGALGALSPDLVGAIVTRVGGRALTSAVAGEPADAETLLASVAAIADTGVDYVKVALPPGLDDATLYEVAAMAPGRVIAVFFAERPIAPDAVMRLARTGFVGAMIDTGAKGGRRLTDHLPLPALSAFAAACRVHGLLSGLAGSLALCDVSVLAGTGAHYLGFRGGLCVGQDRRAGLDPDRVAATLGALRAHGRRDAA